MVPPFDTITATIILAFVAILFIIVLYFLYTYTYWWRRNVPYLTPIIPFGNFKEVLTANLHLSLLCCKLYQKIKSQGHRIAGVFFINAPVVIPTDPALIKNILAVDFEYFNDRGFCVNYKNDPLGYNLFALPTEPWRELRSKLTPTFSSSKIRCMFDLILFCGKNIVEVTKNNAGRPIEITDLSLRYTVDTIGQCAFGLESNSLQNPEETLRQIGERVNKPSVINGIKFLLALIAPSLVKLGNITVLEKQVTTFFINVIKQNIEYRKTNNIHRNDFFQLLLEIQENDKRNESATALKMTAEKMAAQAFVFFAAGFETSAMTINLCLFELSQNLELQQKVRAEIKKVLKENGGNLTYDGLKQMQNLNRCFQETLRKYPPLGFLIRVCVRNYKIPDTNIVLEKGTKVIISLQGLHMDPEYFPNPEKFDPDRFLESNKHNFIQFTNLPFGEGPRNCIGKRFGKTQVLICLALMLSNFEFTLNPMTKLPIEYIPQSFILSSKGSIWLDTKQV